MEVIKRKIYLEDGIDRKDNSSTWGKLTATNFYIKVLLVQNYDDMGIFTDMGYISKEKGYTSPNYGVLINKLTLSGLSFPFMEGIRPKDLANLTETDKLSLRLPSKLESEYHNFKNVNISGSTDSKIEDVRSYNILDPFRVGFNTNEETYINYKSVVVDGVDRVKMIGNPSIYVFNAKNDAYLGTVNQMSGLKYLDYIDKNRDVLIDGETTTIPLTTFHYVGEGFNETNTSLSAISKEEYLFGIISPPEVESDVFIDRGVISVMDMHLRLSEIKDIKQLERYGNGFYKLNK